MPITPQLEAVRAATQFKPGQSGNPAGAKKGTKHISTYIQEALEDENFTARVLDPKLGLKEYKGMPVKAIIQVMLTKAINGDTRAQEMLMKYGWSQKVENEHSGETTINVVTRHAGSLSPDA